MADATHTSGELDKGSFYPNEPMPQSQYPINRTELPEFQALSSLMKRTEAMQKLSVELLRCEKITQPFLRNALEVIIDAYFDLEEKTTQALRERGSDKLVAYEALAKADNALRATDVLIKITKENEYV